MSERHFSHSALADYIRCGKAYELKRLKKLPEPPAWWFIGGRAVHNATQVIDETGMLNADEVTIKAVWQEQFDGECAAEFERWPDEDSWVTYSSQNYQSWAAKGLQYVKNWIQWRKEISWSLLSVEYPVSQTLPNGLEIKAYVDRIFLDEATESIVVVDLKTGSKQPDNPMQLGIYAALLPHDIIDGRPVRAGYWMAKDNKFVEKRVRHWNLDTIGRMGNLLYSGVDGKVFLPVVTNACFICSVKDACYASSGDTVLSRKHDSLNPRYEGA